MADMVKVHVLSCGQGMTNWIEYYADQKDDVPAALGLVDLGGLGVGRTAAVDFIVARLKKHSKSRIDTVVISHQDSDHWNLIPHLFDQLGKQKITLTTGVVWRGGLQWGVRATATVNRLGGISDDKQVHVFADNRCDYHGSKQNLPIWQAGGARLLAMAANVGMTSTLPDMVRNGTSAVVAVEMGGHSIILPGDATWETMSFINQRVYGGTSHGKPGTCIAMSVPHHGALRTAVQGYALGRQYPQMTTKMVTDFAKNISSRSVIASAGFQNTHHHPVTEIMEEFSVKIWTDSKDKHDWMGYDFTNAAWKQFTGVEKKQFTTVTNITGTPIPHNGIYTLTASGTATFDLVEFHPSTGSERVVYHADLHDPLPDDADPAAP